MKTVPIVILGLLFTVTAAALFGASSYALQKATASPTPVARPTDASTYPKSPRPVTELDQENIRELTHRIQKLEIQQLQAVQKPQDDKNAITLATAFIAAGAVLLAALVGMYGQYLADKRVSKRDVAAAQQALELAKQEAIFRHTGTILEFRLKQMEQFYAPMFALLKQSRGLYDKLFSQLAYDEPTRYRLASNPGPRDYRFEVRDKKGEWQGFRLLDQLPAIKTNPRAVALIERVLEIGERMTKIISEHAGLASEDLIDLLGQYLAHYAILSTTYRLQESEPYEPGWHKIGYYPFDLNAKVEEGYRELSRFLDEYVTAGKRMLEALPRRDSEQQS